MKKFGKVTKGKPFSLELYLALYIGVYIIGFITWGVYFSRQSGMKVKQIFS